MRHPFQRRGNPRRPATTPFQRELVSLISSYAEGETRLTGRRFSRLLGKSANHISQMLNDGFVPSGPAILEMAQVLKLDQARQDRLIRAAMETKVRQRSRDNFWIKETSRMLRQAEAERRLFEVFLKREGLSERFRLFASSRARRSRRRPAGK